MKLKTPCTFAFVFAINWLYGQDTVFTFQYPNGIVTDSLIVQRENRYFTFCPANNHKLIIALADNHVKEVRFANGQKFKNSEVVENREILFPTDPLTGKIFCSKVIEVKDVKCKDLFNIYKTIPQGEIRYNLLASDETGFSFQKYIGVFNVKFAGDPYVMTFNLLLKFKDGKVKYEYSDFVATFEETRSKGSLNGQNVFASGVYTRTNAHMKNLDKMYAGEGMGDEKYFWKPTRDNLSASMGILEKLGKDAAANVNGDW